MEADEIKVHPVQKLNRHLNAVCPAVVTLRAYEVYAKVWAPQEALIKGDCRGGFSAGELIAFLYAHSFPESEWRSRYEEASRGMKNL